jgi:DNA-binding NtrC family response regulator
LAVCRYRDWDTFSPDQLPLRDESVLVANAVPRSEQAVRFLRFLREHPIKVPTLAILPAEDGDLLEIAAEAVDDFLLFPVNENEFRLRFSRLLGVPPLPIDQARAALECELGLQQMVGLAPSFQQVVGRATTFAGSDAPVLLTVDTGTGKELCARFIHLLSKRRHGPFIPVECGAVPEHLFENEVFGHSRGAFTDAHVDQKGLVALAQGGTLFFDEVDSLSPSVQAKILRLLQEKTYRPLGSEQFRSSNVRIIAATNRNLEALVREKKFREDLFFRLNVLRLHLPTLCQRPEDIAVLARHFMQEICVALELAPKVLSPAAIRKLEGHDWPGNVRELYNTLQRAILCSSGKLIAGAQIEFCRLEPDGPTSPTHFRSAKLLAIEKFEREYVQNVLEQCGGNITRSARAAGKDRRAFARLAKKHGLSQRAS